MFNDYLTTDVIPTLKKGDLCLVELESQDIDGGTEWWPARVKAPSKSLEPRHASVDVDWVDSTGGAPISSNLDKVSFIIRMLSKLGPLLRQRSSSFHRRCMQWSCSKTCLFRYRISPKREFRRTMPRREEEEAQAQEQAACGFCSS